MPEPSSCLIKGLKAQKVNDKMVERPGIPKKSKVRVESLPKRFLVWEGVVSRSLVLDLDPGRYIVKISKSTDSGIGNTNYCYDFYHDITAEQWERLIHAKPKFARCMNTSEGPRWRCRIPGCDFEGTSMTSAVLHESEHFGVDMLNDPSLKAQMKVSEGVIQLQSLTGDTPGAARKAALEDTGGKSFLER